MSSNNLIDTYHEKRQEYVAQVWGVWRQLSWFACFLILVTLCVINPETPKGYRVVQAIGFIGLILFVLTIAFNLFIHQLSPPVNNSEWRLDSVELIYVSERSVMLLGEVLEAVGNADPERLANALRRVENDAPELLEFDLILDLQRYGVETLRFHSSRERG